MTALLVCVLLYGGPVVAPDRFTEGERAYREGKFTEARIAFEAALEAGHGARGATLHNLGMCAAREGNDALAIYHLLRARRHQPGDDETATQLAAARRRLGIAPRRASWPQRALGAIDGWPRSRLFAVAALLQALAVLGLLRARGIGARALLVCVTLVALAGAGRAVFREWYAATEAVVLAPRVALRTEPHSLRPARAHLDAGTVVQVREGSERWLHVTHPRGSGWVRRDAVGVID